MRAALLLLGCAVGGVGGIALRQPCLVPGVEAAAQTLEYGQSA
jgi:hypothetical protein